MNAQDRRLRIAVILPLVVWLAAIGSYAHPQAAGVGNDFRSLLELAELGPEVLAALTLDSDCTPQDWSDAEWNIVGQLFARLEQYPEEQLQQWVATQPMETILADAAEQVGALVELSGTILAVEPLAVPADVAATLESSTLYLCRLSLADASRPAATVIARHVPQRWSLSDFTPQIVSLQGILLPSCESSGNVQIVILTNRLRWFPIEGVPSGQRLLAAHGMDASLWDEVVQRAPFVSPEVKRESTAFYSALAAVGRVPSTELRQRANEHVAAQGETWQSRRANIEATVGQLRSDLATVGEQQRPELQQQLESETRLLALSRAVVEQAERGLSSVAPLFLQPEEHVGELVVIEGIARRAVRIVAEEANGSFDSLPAVEEYYELDVFTSDSQNLPVVCCVNRLPEGFPTGDAIREPVRVAGVFFKNWRFRTRELVEGPGETKQQQPLYTPIVIADSPTWVQAAPTTSGWGSLIAGIIFLLLLGGAWWMTVRTPRRSRITRPASDTVDFRDL